LTYTADKVQPAKF